MRDSMKNRTENCMSCVNGASSLLVMGNIPRLANQISHPSGGVVNCPTPGTLRSVKFSPLRARGLGGDVRISNWIGTFFR